MSRASQSQGAVMTTILNTMTSKKGDYKEGINKNQALAKAMADRVAINGTLEEDLMSMIKGENDEDESILPEEEIQSFLSEQRERLKSLAAKNAIRDWKIDNFVGAINQLKEKVATDTTGELYEEGTKYEAIIEELMAQEAARNQMDAMDSNMYKEVCEKLGEKVNRAGTNQADDDDIEVVRNNTATETTFKCPITSTWMEDPVKSKDCSHSYSRAGILHLIHSGKGKCACPVFGCQNKTITAATLEDDLYLAAKVKTSKRRAAAEDEQRAMSQALECDDDEEEEEMM